MTEVWGNLVLALGFIAIDCTYFALSTALNCALRLKSRLTRRRDQDQSHGGGECRERVVIVGGGFAGLRALQILRTRFDCTLIDRKNFFEYTPGILRAVVKPSHLSRLAAPLPPARVGDSSGSGSGGDSSDGGEGAVTFVGGEVVRLERRAVIVRGAANLEAATTENESESQDEDQRRALLRPAPTAGAATAPTPRGSGTERAIKYDYLLLGSGSSYAAPIKPAPATATLAGRRAELDAQHVQLRAARTVLIVGGGLVGVELAGELLHFCPWLSRVTVTDMAPEVCAALPAPVRRYLQGWLERQPRCQLVLGARIAGAFPRLAIDAFGCTLSDGRRLGADVVFRCTGGRAEAGYAAVPAAAAAAAAAAPATPPAVPAASMGGDTRGVAGGNRVRGGTPLAGLPVAGGALQVDDQLRVLGPKPARATPEAGLGAGAGTCTAAAAATATAAEDIPSAAVSGTPTRDRDRDRDIFLEVICKECGVTRERAAAAFRESKGDVPTAVLALMREADAAQAGEEAAAAEPLDGGRVFAMGDCAWHASAEPKLGHTAEVNAELAAHNVLLAARGGRLLRYPRGVVGGDRTPRIYCISLGPYYGSLYFNGLVINGRLPAVVKHVLELTKVAAARGDALGTWFWEVADAAANFLGRTVLVEKK